MAAVVDGQRGQHEPGRDPAAHPGQLVPPAAREVLDPGRHLEPSTMEVEVRDDGRCIAFAMRAADDE